MLSHFTKLNGYLSKIYMRDNKFYWMDHIVPSCISLTECNRGIVVQCQRPTGSIGESRKPPHCSPFHSVPCRRTGKTDYWVKILLKFLELSHSRKYVHVPFWLTASIPRHIESSFLSSCQTAECTLWLTLQVIISQN